MPFLILAILTIFGVCLWLVDGWLASHALVVAVGKQWEISAHGWGLLLSLGGPMAAFGLLAGLAIGIPAGSRLLGLLAEQQGAEIDATREALAAERLKLEAAKAALDGQIRQAAAQGRQEGAAIAQEATQARFVAEDRAMQAERRMRALERREKGMEGRLKGAQQKAARMQKKAQLMRGDAPKPA